MKTLGEPGDVLSDYAKHELRREAWVMRAADPTFPKNIVPTDHVLIPASLWGTLQFCVCVRCKQAPLAKAVLDSEAKVMEASTKRFGRFMQTTEGNDVDDQARQHVR